MNNIPPHILEILSGRRRDLSPQTVRKYREKYARLGYTLPEPALPGTATVLRNATKALIRGVKTLARTVTREVALRRLEICEGCDQFRPSDRRCADCTCYVDHKVKRAAEECPLKKWLAEPVKKKRDAAARRASKRPSRFTPVPYSGPIVRNLAFHCYPRRGSYWRWHCQMLRKYAAIFNGRRLVSVAVDGDTDSADDVRRELGPGFEVTQVKNVRAWGEMTSFPTLLRTLIDDNPNAITFYAHSKGVSYDENGRSRVGRRTHDYQTIRRWAEALYAANLTRPDLVDEALKTHGVCGAFRRDKPMGTAPWFFSGSFYWIRHAHAVQVNWNNFIKPRHGSEAWPGMVFQKEQTSCVCADSVDSLYDPAEWERRLDAEIAEFERGTLSVFTVSLGGYDRIRTPATVNPDVRYIAITDGDAPEPWSVVRPPASSLKVLRRSRHLKIMDHLHTDSEWTLYHDGNKQLLVDPLKMLAEFRQWCGEKDVYLFEHPERDCLYAEAREIQRLSLDRSEDLRQQTERYRAAGFPEHAGLFLGGVVLRRHPQSRSFNEAWWQEVLQGSWRDQMSLPTAALSAKAGIMPTARHPEFFVIHRHAGRRARI